MSRAEFYGKKCKEIAAIGGIYSLIFWIMFILALIKKSKTYGLISGIIYVIANVAGFIYMNDISKNPEDYLKGVVGEVFKD